MKAASCGLVVCLLFQLTGCAAMFHGSSDQITIQSADSDAKIFMDNVLIGKGSAMASVKRNTQYSLAAKKDGCSDHVVQTQNSFDAVSLLGILIDFGLITMLVIDWGATGAMWKTDPLIYHVTPICDRPKASYMPLLLLPRS